MELLVLRKRIWAGPWAAMALMASSVVAACHTVNEDRGEISYFPPTEFADLDIYDADVPDRFSKYLRGAEESILFDDQAIEFAARLTIISSFEGGIVLLVQKNSDGSTTGRSKRFAQREGGIGKLLESTRVTVSTEELHALRQLAVSADFWSVDNQQELIGSDGSAWVLEVKDGSCYHAVYEWWPSEGPSYEIGHAIMKALDVRFDDR